jgi:hypothetical protein
VEEYLEKGAQVNYKKWVYGPDLCFTPLHFAVFNGERKEGIQEDTVG